MEPCIIVHGGSRTILGDEKKEKHRKGVQLAARKGHEVLLKSGSALDAVEAAVRYMEDSPIFNAGHGSALTEENTAELDGFIMDGHNLATGAVACVEAIANPVSLARKVMEDTPHCILAGEGALKFAKKSGFPVLENPLELATAESHERSKEASYYLGKAGKWVNADAPDVNGTITGQGFDTVGAVAVDSKGRLASATSTGGLPRKMLGRVGDTPCCGCGGYANASAAASTTGHGESILKMVLAWDVVRNIEDGLNPMQACGKSINKMVSAIDGVGGVIALNSDGEIGRAFSSKQLAWASIRGQVLKFGLDRGEVQEVPL